MRVKDASHRVPALCTTIVGWLSAASGWHCMLCSIRHRWDLSCWVYCSIRNDPIKSKDHSRIPGSRGFLSSYRVVLRRCIRRFSLQQSGRGSAAKQWDKLNNILNTTRYTVEVKTKHVQCCIPAKWVIWALHDMPPCPYWAIVRRQVLFSSHFLLSGIPASHLSTGEM